MVIRYDTEGHESPSGYVVAYEDYAELEKRLAEAERTTNQMIETRDVAVRLSDSRLRRTEVAEQRAAELQGDNEELTKDLAWHKQYAMRWEQAASVAMKQAADLQARLDRVEAASLSAAALLQRWADQIKDCHTTEAGEWMDEEEAEADYNELIKAIRALSAQPKAAAKQFLETSEPSSGSAEPAPSAAPAERRKQERRIQPCETPHSRRFIERRNSAAPDTALSGLEVAIQFHELYESLAPQFGYETRPETRQFDPESKNGKLMIAVCAEIERRRNKA